MRKYFNGKLEENTGLGANSNQNGNRWFNQNGNPNVFYKGNLFETFSFYNFLMKMSWINFILTIFLYFLLINLIFTFLYFYIGFHELVGLEHESGIYAFLDVYFFSTQTFTTVGYGRVNPIGIVANAIAAIEALIGLLSFALITGLSYGRFSKPKAYVKFSKNVLINTLNDPPLLTFRLVPIKQTFLSQLNIKANISLKKANKNEFFNMHFQLDSINSLFLSWTLAHKIDESSPFYNKTKEDIINENLEIMVFLTAYDEAFSNTVVARADYHASEIVWDAKFKPMFYPSDDKTKTIVNLQELDSIEYLETTLNL